MSMFCLLNPWSNNDRRSAVLSLSAISTLLISVQTISQLCLSSLNQGYTAATYQSWIPVQGQLKLLWEKLEQGPQREGYSVWL